MRYDITNIPVAEVFEEGDGCPICRLRNQLEQRMVEYITGAAMMEPDIRIETNRQGFCLGHYRMLLKRRNRLGVALMLETHLEELEKTAFSGLSPVGKSRRPEKAAARKGGSCYVCGRVDDAMEKMLATVCRTWESQREFRQLFERQDYICLPHFKALSQAAASSVSKRQRSDFLRAASDLARNQLVALRADVHHFTEMYDYHNAQGDADWGNSKDSIERSILYLTSREP